MTHPECPSASRPGSIAGDCGAEHGDAAGAGDPVVGGDGQGQPGVIIDPAQDRRPGPTDKRPKWVKSACQHSFGRFGYEPPRPGIQRKRLRHDDHPSSEKQILTGKESTEPGALPALAY